VAKKNAFQRFVADYGGPKELAHALDYSENAVYRWLEGNRTPKIQTIFKIIQLAKGSLSAEQIVACTSYDLRGRGTK
jgi:transcriptional regulator with XRE-family HTH domain